MKFQTNVTTSSRATSYASGCGTPGSRLYPDKYRKANQIIIPEIRYLRVDAGTLITYNSAKKLPSDHVVFRNPLEGMHKRLTREGEAQPTPALNNTVRHAAEKLNYTMSSKTCIYSNTNGKHTHVLN